MLVVIRQVAGIEVKQWDVLQLSGGSHTRNMGASSSGVAKIMTNRKRN